MSYSSEIDARISAEDLRFCKNHQKAYEKSRCFLTRIAEEAGEFQAEQEALLGRKFDEIIVNPYAGQLSQAAALKQLQDIHAVFVNKIVDYFSETYCFKLYSYPILVRLLPPHPEPSATNGWKYDKAAEEDYTRQLCNLSLSYKEIVEQIFVQAGARSALELKARAISAIREKAHNAAWNYLGERQYTQTEQKVILPNAFRKSAYSQERGFKLSNEAADIMEALAFFESSASGVREPSLSLLRSNYFNWRHYVGGQKVEQVLCYKNGQIYIAFTSESNAQEFVEKYLGVEA